MKECPFVYDLLYCVAVFVFLPLPLPTFFPQRAEQVPSTGTNGTPVGLTGAPDCYFIAAYALGRAMEAPSSVVAKFDYTYDHIGQTISIKKGESFNLLSKATPDWWHVRRKQGAVLEDLYVPATYVQEVKSSIKAARSLDAGVPRKSSLPHGMHLAETGSEDANNIYENVPKIRGGSPGPFLSPPVAKKPQIGTRSLGPGQISKERPRSFYGGNENPMPPDLIKSLGGGRSKPAPKTGHSYEQMQLKSPSTGQSAAAQGDGGPPAPPAPDVSGCSGALLPVCVCVPYMPL